MRLRRLAMVIGVTMILQSDASLPSNVHFDLFEASALAPHALTFRPSREAGFLLAEWPLGNAVPLLRQETERAKIRWRKRFVLWADQAFDKLPAGWAVPICLWRFDRSLKAIVNAEGSIPSILDMLDESRRLVRHFERLHAKEGQWGDFSFSSLRWGGVFVGLYLREPTFSRSQAVELILKGVPGAWDAVHPNVFPHVNTSA